MAVKPAIKDISVILTNAPQLMLGTKQYPLTFTIMNLRNDVKDVSVEFASKSLKMDSTTFDLTLAPQDKQSITVTVTPEKDGALDLAVTINEKKTIKYTETVLEGHENDMHQEAAPAATPTPAPVTAAAVTPAKPIQKPTGAPVKPVKPSGAAAPVTVPAVQKPAGAPVKPMKPAGEITPAKPVKPAVIIAPQKVAVGAEDALEKRILSIKDKYMAARTTLQSLKQGSPEYMRTYQEAVKYKEQYEKLKSIYESGGTMADAEAAVPSESKDPVTELKELGQRYTDMKNRLSMLSPGSPEYEKLKQEAMAVYKEYNDKRNKAKAQGIVV
ncbi:MAG: hypothetical protein Q6373_020175 [Candidatus Sigynarchaeota archaeon]